MPVAHLLRLCAFRWYDPDGNLGRLTEVWTVECDRRNRPTPHAALGFLVQPLEQSIVCQGHVRTLALSRLGPKSTTTTQRRQRFRPPPFRPPFDGSLQSYRQVIPSARIVCYRPSPRPAEPSVKRLTKGRRLAYVRWFFSAAGEEERHAAVLYGPGGGRRGSDAAIDATCERRSASHRPHAARNTNSDGNLGCATPVLAKARPVSSITRAAPRPLALTPAARRPPGQDRCRVPGGHGRISSRRREAEAAVRSTPGAGPLPLTAAWVARPSRPSRICCRCRMRQRRQRPVRQPPPQSSLWAGASRRAPAM